MTGSFIPTSDPARYGRRKVSKMLAEVNRHREAVRAGDPVATEQTWEKLEQWLDLTMLGLLSDHAWQPIETAPKDGTEVLVWARWDWDGMYGEECGGGYMPQVAVWDLDESRLRVVSFSPFSDAHWAVKPTHWMPIPPIEQQKDGP